MSVTSQSKSPSQIAAHRDLELLALRNQIATMERERTTTHNLPAWELLYGAELRGLHSRLRLLEWHKS